MEQNEEFVDEGIAGDDKEAAEAEKLLKGLADQDADEGEAEEEKPEPVEKEVPKEKAGKAPKASSEVRAMEKEIESLRKQNKEREESERYWYEEAKKRVEAPAKAAPVEEEDPFAKESVEELISALGTKGRAALTERGFVTKKDMVAEVRRMIAEDAPKFATAEVKKTEAKLQRDAEITARFPDLKPGTPFFEEASVQLKALVAAGNAPDSNTLERAAERAELEILKRQVASGSKQSRIAQQLPSRGERGGGDEEAEEASTIGPVQRSIMKSMGVDEKEYRKYMGSEKKGRRN